MNALQTKSNEAEARQALRAIADGIVDAVREAGSMGTPAGPMYAAMMVHGFTLEQFEAITGALVQLGKLRR